MAATRQIVAPLYDGLRVTREEYCDLAEDGFKYDMIDGVITLTPSADFLHGGCQARFAFLLEAYLGEHPVARVVTEVDVLLPDGGDVLRPDLTLLLKEHLALVKTHIHGVPDLVCEILSDRTAARDLGEKADRYLACGVREYWIVDPRDRTAAVWYNEGNTWTKSSGEELASRVLDGFNVSRGRLFPDEG